MTGDPERDADDRASRADQAPPPHGLDPLLAGEDRLISAPDAVPVAAPWTPSRARAKSSMPTLWRQRGQQRRDHRAEQAEQVEAAVSVDVAGLAEDRRGQPVGEERPDHGPGQDRDGGVELRRDRRQRDDEHREGEVQGEQPGQQRPQHPPLVARGRRRRATALGGEAARTS